jgi:antitoxin (DNA-binding transcriptional repressor) of toxin-antitoxin stability system
MFNLRELLNGFESLALSRNELCDAKMYHMNKASIRDLRYDFKKIERLLHQGEEVQITKRRRVIARLVPEGMESSAAVPDFLSRLRKIYGEKMLTKTGAQVLDEDRSRY